VVIVERMVRVNAVDRYSFVQLRRQKREQGSVWIQKLRDVAYAFLGFTTRASLPGPTPIHLQCTPVLSST
jgi:hypothetical protein